MAQAVSAPTTMESAPRWKRVTAVTCLVLAALLTVPAAFAFWGQRTINDGQRYVDTVGPLVDSPEVQAAIATKVTGVLEEQVDVEALVNQVFAGVITERPRLQALVGPLSGAINGLIETQVRAFIASDAFADFWVAANTRAQAALIRILSGDGSGAVSVQGDQVVLDVSQVIDQVKQRLVDRGLTIIDKVPVSTPDREIVLLEAPQLEQARTIYAFANPLARWLLVFVVGLYLAALLLARRRSTMTMIIGAALAANALLVALMLSIGRQLFVNELAGTVFAPASSVFYHQLLSYLERGQRVLLWLGLFFVVVGWFAGRGAFATATRTTLGGGLESVGSALSDGPTAGTGRWVSVNAGWLRVAVALLGVVVLLWGNDVSEARLFWSLVLVLVLLVAVQVLVGAGQEPQQTAGDAPPPSQDPTDPSDPGRARLDSGAS